MTYCGFISIVGRPNVGKSTILNKLIEQKLAITSKKVQTTRHQILGVYTKGEKQMVFIDTPGIHFNEKGKTINTIMNKSAVSSLLGVNLICWVIDKLDLKEDDLYVFEKIKQLNLPVVIVINKIDLLDSKKDLFPFMEKLQSMHNFKAIIPISAKHNNGVEELRKFIGDNLPEAEHYFGEDEITNRSERFFISEIIREKVFRLLGEEVPYSVAVEIESLKINPRGVYIIHAAIWTERMGQKKIIIGEKGAKIKQIGLTARVDIEKFVDAKVHLELWVKVKSGWSDNERILKSLGYGDDV
ncbi:MAG: GTPase Era [Psittacicella sp.]